MQTICQSYWNRNSYGFRTGPSLAKKIINIDQETFVTVIGLLKAHCAALVAWNLNRSILWQF